MTMEDFDPACGVPSPFMLKLLQAVADGKSAKDWAAERGRSYQATRNILRLAREALGAETTPQAVAMAIRRGLIK